MKYRWGERKLSLIFLQQGPQIFTISYPNVTEEHDIIDNVKNNIGKETF